MIILITGDKGFIGSHLKTKLVSDGHTVLGYDLLDNYNIKDLNEKHIKAVDKIVHLAAFADVRESIKNPNKWYKNNVDYSSNIFKIAAKCKTPIIYASSSCVKEWWKSPYGTSKKVMEDMANAFGKSIGLRFSNVYGDGARDIMLIPKMLKGKLEYSTNHKRDFVHVDDVVEVIRMFLTMPNFNDLDKLIYNVGTGKSISIANLVKRYGFDVPIREGHSSEMNDNTADIADLAKLGWTAKQDLDKYLKRKLNGNTNYKEHVQGLLS